MTSFLQGVCGEGKRRRGEANAIAPTPAAGPPKLGHDLTLPKQPLTLEDVSFSLLTLINPSPPQKKCVCAPHPLTLRSPPLSWGAWKMVK